MKKNVWITLWLLLVGFFIFGCVSFSNPLSCNPNYVNGVIMPSNSSIASNPTDFMTACKNTCYNFTQGKSASFKLTIATTPTCTSQNCNNSSYDNRCWCDVSNCGLNSTEYS